MKTRIEVLSPDERAQVHERTLHVLETVGMRVDTAAGRRILKDVGALVDESTRIVRFPPALVEELLALAPRQYSLGGRRPGWEFPLNAGEATLCLDGGPTLVLDRHTRERRPSTRADWLEAIRLSDAIDEIGVLWSPVSGWLAGESSAGFVDYAAGMQRAFSKHVQDSFDDPAEARWQLEILEIVFGGRDEVRRLHPYSFLITPVSPLVIEAAGADAWLALRGYDIPLAIMPMPLMGATAPGSMLATTLLANCEVLGVICLAQAAEPGTPIIHAPTLATMDPRSGRLADNAPQAALNIAGVEMARYYGLPAFGSGGGTDAFAPGIQSGYERTFGTVLGALAWPDVLVGPGGLAGSTVFCFEQMLVDVEVWRLSRKAHAGIEVADDGWLTDVLQRVGPGGQFLSEKSTRVNARSGEWYFSRLGWHGSCDAWTAAGCPDTLDEAREKVDAILAAHEPLPLGEDVEGALAELRGRALRHDGGSP
ncbi:MAG: trimethylamine methyltransferase family protein [Actinomycetes bacterium]